MLKKWVPLWTLPTLVLFAIGTVWVRLTIVDTTYAIGEIDRQTRVVRQTGEGLQVRLAALRSPRHLELLARTRFHLNQPSMEQVIRLSKERAHVH